MKYLTKLILFSSVLVSTCGATTNSVYKWSGTNLLKSVPMPPMLPGMKEQSPTFRPIVKKNTNFSNVVSVQINPMPPLPIGKGTITYGPLQKSAFRVASVPTTTVPVTLAPIYINRVRNVMNGSGNIVNITYINAIQFENTTILFQWSDDLINWTTMGSFGLYPYDQPVYWGWEIDPMLEPPFIFFRAILQ